MKKLMFIAAIITLFSLQTNAQRGPGQRGGEIEPEKIAERMTNRLSENLSLSEEQQNEIYKLNLEQAKEREAHREAQREAMKNQRAEMKARQDAHQKKIEAVLTPEQLEKWTEIKNEQQEKRDRVRDGRGNPDSEKIREFRRKRSGGGNSSN